MIKTRAGRQLASVFVCVYCVVCVSALAAAGYGVIGGGAVVKVTLKFQKWPPSLLPALLSDAGV